MEAKIFSSLCPKPAFLFVNCHHPFKARTYLRPTTPHGPQSLNAEPGMGGGEPENSNPPPNPTPNTVEIRFRRGSRRKRAREQKQKQLDYKDGLSSPPTPKEWESMTITEKAVELYMGEKGLLFWLNKFAYASIFVVIGAWILFRFIGPSLGLYQLDSPLPSPSTILKGS
eukprot:TRINITY_DN3470_c0_g1_i1.p1 TRINITY_DN3470_c0_g1~~TRINITY_DN3470_c0_g1_i1.p1  ORF type:complete len:170 (-),score=25.56 TRINITY_DN3470_c0_g1_i1:256-765(-)